MKLNPQASSSSQVVARAKKIRCIGPWRKFLLPFFHVARFLPPFRKSIWRSSCTQRIAAGQIMQHTLNKHNVSNCPVNCGGERKSRDIVCAAAAVTIYYGDVCHINSYILKFVIIYKSVTDGNIRIVSKRPILSSLLSVSVSIGAV